MGLSGRAASRNAMARMNGSTPSGSRGGTPNPSQEGREDDDDDDAGSVKGASGGVRKKLLKKGLDKKIKKMGEKGGSVNGKLPKVSGGNKKTPGTSRASPAPSGGGEGKRERDEFDEDDDEVHVKKRQKLTRVGSIASIASSNALGHDLERTESQDGSFVDDASVADD